MTENPYATPGASLEAPEVSADPRGLHRVRLGVELLVGAELAALGSHFLPRFVGPAAQTLAAIVVALVGGVGVFLATTPVAERSRFITAARAFAVAAVLSSASLLLWQNGARGAPLSGAALWASYGISMIAAIANSGTQCLVLVVLRSVLTMVGDLRGLRANTVGVWLVAMALAAQQISIWAWRIAGNEIVETLERLDAVGEITLVRGFSLFFSGVLALAAFVFYLGGLIRVRRHSNRLLAARSP